MNAPSPDLQPAPRATRRTWTLRALGTLALLGAAWLVLRSGWAVPANPAEVMRQRFATTRLLDRHGQVLELWAGTDNSRHRPVSLDEISPHLIGATLALEDHRFWTHFGVDPLAIARATWDNLRAGQVTSGASTLTQQLCKWLTPRPRTLIGKLIEAVEASNLEAVLSKREILELYLNYAPYGGLQRGAEQASRAWLGKAAKDLTWAEAAWLAVLPRSPSRLNPARDPKAALPDQQRLLRKLADLQWLTQAELQTALAQPIAIVVDPTRHREPHLAAWVTDHVPQLLIDRPRSVRTTLDAELNEAAAQRARAHLLTLADRDVGNAAIVAIDNESGDVRVMVGSTAFGDAKHLGANNGAVALRQPGSTIKALTYAAAFAGTWSPASVLADVSATFETPQGPWTPQNYGLLEHGPVRARVALASSLNVPAVRLLQAMGVDKLRDLLALSGFDSLSRDAAHYGLALTLGDGEVTLVELTNAFAMMARQGRYLAPRVVDEVVGWDGEAARLPVDKPRDVIDATAAWQVLDVLSDPAARELGFGRGGPLEMPFAVASKTGTSKGFRDNWAVGASTRWTVGVWVGNFDAKPMKDVTGITGAGPLLREILLLVHGDESPPPFVRPEGMSRRRICPLSGGLWTPLCGPSLDEWLRDDQVPQPCAWHREVALDKRNGLRAGALCPHSEVVQRVGLDPPAQYAAWAKGQSGVLPADYSPLCPNGATDPTSAAAVRIVQPTDGARILLDPHTAPQDQQLGLRAELADRAARVQWHVDGQPVGDRVPGDLPVLWRPTPGTHRIQVDVVGPDGQPSGHASVRIQVAP